MPPHDPHRLTIGRWLTAWAVVVFALVIVGGATRLTESGLSITEWQPVRGVIPPMSPEAWAAEFEKYKQIPQYSQMNAGMTLAQFKGIFLWEYSHRLLARLGGLVFAIPFFWFWFRKTIPRDAMPRIVAIGVLTIAQAALGWYMVASGLTERVNVSQYRLAAHLSVAVVIYLLSVWTADALMAPEGGGRSGVTADAARWRSALRRSLALAFLTLVSGAFVAGLRAGKIYNEFPMMGAGPIPAEYSALSPWWKNLFENPASVQFNHRLLAVVTAVTVVVVWFRARRVAGAALRLRLDLSLAAVGVQVALGITVLVMSVPLAVAIAHQAGALLLLTALTMALREASAPDGTGVRVA